MSHQLTKFLSFSFLREREPTPPPDNVKPEEIKKEETEDDGEVCFLISFLNRKPFEKFELGSDDDDSEIEEMLQEEKKKMKDVLICQYDRISRN